MPFLDVNVCRMEKIERGTAQSGSSCSSQGDKHTQCSSCVQTHRLNKSENYIPPLAHFPLEYTWQTAATAAGKQGTAKLL